MLLKLWHKLFHPPKHKHIHTYIENSMQIEYEDFGGFITADYKTVCPICGYVSKTSSIFLFANLEEIEKQQKLASNYDIQQPFTTSLEEAVQECINYKGD